MSEDTKLDFYLKHRHQIEEWAALRDGARQALDEVLLAALTARAQEPGSLLHVEPTAGSYRYVRWRIPGPEMHPVWIELYWNYTTLLRGTADAAWPYLVVVVSGTAEPSYAPTRTRVREAVRGHHVRHGLVPGRGASSWVWSTSLAPAEEPITVDGYVDYCVLRFESAWTELHPVILRATHHPDDHVSSGPGFG